MIEKIQIDFETAKTFDIKERIWYIWKQSTNASRPTQLAIRESWENGDLNLLIPKNKYEPIFKKVVDKAYKELKL